MAYIGANPQTSLQQYLTIDDISGSFNGVLTSFALQVGGVAPVPGPSQSNQLLISLGGVIQEPDDTGSAGFRLSGGNIIFSSAPAAATAFFGVVLAGADYIYAGTNFPDGSVATPSITFANDLDSGFYRTGSGELAYTSNGTFRLKIDSSGRVGVGTSSPSDYLHISGSGGATAAVRLQANDGRSYLIGSTGSGYGSANNFIIYDATASAERLRITSAGNVGVGTTSPGFAIDVQKSGTNPAISLNRTDAATAGSITLASGNANNYLDNGGTKDFTINTSSTERLRIDSSGRVGIGTSSPTSYANSQTALVIEDDGAPAICWSDTGQTRDWWAVALGSALSFRYADGGGSGSPTNVTNLLHLENNGNVGIATTNPTAPLTIQGGSGASPTIRLNGGAGDDNARIESKFHLYLMCNGDGNQSGRAVIFGNSTAELARVDSSGRLLVGTPSAEGFNGLFPRLQVEGTDNSTARMSLFRISDNNGGPAFTFAKARNTSHKVLQSDDYLGQIDWYGSDGNDTNQIGARISARIDGTPGSNDLPGRLEFSTTADGAGSPTERMRITSAGRFLYGCTSDSGSSDVGVKISDDTNNPWLRIVGNESTGSNFFLSGYNTNATNNGYRFYVKFDGGIVNHSGNNVNLCDEREKKNIETLDSTWGCLKSWELKKFHYNDDADTDDKKYGVIAQQVAPHCPEVITDWVKQKAEDAVLDDDGNVVTPAKEEIVRMGVKEQQMMWMAIKALQEAQTRIETLEAEVAALKGA
jgi:hypothetical protein